MIETSVFYDIPNLSVCVFTVFVVSIWARLPRPFIIILLLNCIVPFFLNGFLFSADYMPDQFRYQENVFGLRNGIDIFESSSTVLNASYLLSFIPLPLVMTIKSLGFFNKFIYIVLFGFLYKKKILNKFSAYCFLLYPSIVLYSGLSLRDTLIAFFMFMTCYAAVKRNLFLLILFIAPLWFIKFQNFVIMLPVLFYLLFDIDKKGMSLRAVMTILVCLVSAAIVLFPLLIPAINIHRINMYVDDGGRAEDVELIVGLSDFIFSGMISSVYFLMKPLPWEVQSIMQLIQSVENIVVGGILFMVTKLAWEKHPDRLMFWFLFFIISMSIYGLVVFNYGSAARYRFPFVLIYLTFVCYSCDIRGLTNKR